MDIELSRAERERLLDELAETAPADVPALSDYAVSREGLYEERDSQLIKTVTVDSARIKPALRRSDR